MFTLDVNSCQFDSKNNIIVFKVKDSYADSNGTQWTLCEINRIIRNQESRTPLIINSYLNMIIITQVAMNQAVNLNAVVVANKGKFHCFW